MMVNLTLTNMLNVLQQKVVMAGGTMRFDILRARNFGEGELELCVFGMCKMIGMGMRNDILCFLLADWRWIRHMIFNFIVYFLLQLQVMVGLLDSKRVCRRQTAEIINLKVADLGCTRI